MLVFVNLELISYSFTFKYRSFMKPRNKLLYVLSPRNIVLILFLLFSTFYFKVNTFAQTSEYTVKAVFLEGYTRFIEWPESGDAESFIICILGKSPFGETLEEVVITVNS